MSEFSVRVSLPLDDGIEDMVFTDALLNNYYILEQIDKIESGERMFLRIYQNGKDTLLPRCLVARSVIEVTADG